MLLLLLSVLGVRTGLAAPAEGGAGGSVAAKSAAERAVDRLFDGQFVPRFEITVGAKELQVLRRYHRNFGPQEDRESVPATVREGGTVYTNVALKLKGAAGSFRSVDDRPALTLNFDKLADGQRFHGLRKLSLNNSVQDPTLMNEKFCRELFLQAGVPVPRAGHARVIFNGRDLGLYVLLEGWDKDFLKRHFPSAKGVLYEGGFLRDIDERLSVNAGEESDDQLARKKLVEVARISDETSRAERLKQVLDVDRFLRYVAMDSLMWNWDGYPMHRNNWRLYHEPTTGKFVFMPHGLDQMFWRPDGPILPPMEGLVANAVLDVPEFRARYFDRMREFTAGLFKPEVVTNRIDAIGGQIAKALEEIDPDMVPRHRRAVANLKRAVVERHANLLRQMQRPMMPMEFDASGIASLAGWEGRGDFGKAELVRIGVPGLTERLVVRCPEGSSIGTWRKTVWLGRGVYKLEGRVRAANLTADPGDPRAGAALRTKATRPDAIQMTNTDWTLLQHEFRVDEALSEVTLLCEVRSCSGEAAFESGSLRLRRISGKR